MAKNPWLSLWLSAANTWTGAARGFWTAEMHRQQKAMLNEMTRPKSRSSTKDSLIQESGIRGAKESQRLITPYLPVRHNSQEQCLAGTMVIGSRWLLFCMNGGHHVPLSRIIHVRGQGEG